MTVDTVPNKPRGAPFCGSLRPGVEGLDPNWDSTLASTTVNYAEDVWIRWTGCLAGFEGLTFSLASSRKDGDYYVKSLGFESFSEAYNRFQKAIDSGDGCSCPRPVGKAFDYPLMPHIPACSLYGFAHAARLFDTAEANCWTEPYEYSSSDSEASDSESDSDDSDSEDSSSCSVSSDSPSSSEPSSESDSDSEEDDDHISPGDLPDPAFVCADRSHGIYLPPITTEREASRMLYERRTARRRSRLAARMQPSSPLSSRSSNSMIR